MTSASRRVSAVLGAVALVVGGVAFVVGVIELVFRLDAGDALSAFLVCGAAWCLAAWLWGARATVGWTAFALLAGGAATDGRWLLAGAALVALAIVVTVTLGLTVRTLRDLGTIPPEPAGKDEVMPDTEASVAEYEEAGFRRAGAYAFSISGQRIVVSVLSGPDDDRLALLTGKVRQVVSRFGDRLFVTSNVLSVPVPGEVLRQQPSYGTKLVDAHRAALEVLAQRGLTPDVFGNENEMVETGLALESRTCRFLAEAPAWELLRRLPRGRARRPLADDHRSRRRIDAWLDARDSS